MSTCHVPRRTRGGGNKDKCLVKFRRPGIRQSPPWVINTIKPPAYYPGPGQSLHSCSKRLSTSFKTHIPLINTLCWGRMSRHRGLTVPVFTHLLVSFVPSHFRRPSPVSAFKLVTNIRIGAPVLWRLMKSRRKGVWRNSLSNKLNVENAYPCFFLNYYCY